LHIFHCACAKRPYFHFRSKIWRRRHVPRPKFPVRRGNFGDSRKFNAVIGLLLTFACILKTASPKTFLGQNGERGGAMFTPTNSFLLLVVFTSVPILVKVHQEMLAWKCTQTDTRTKANGFYHLFHAAIAMGQIIIMLYFFNSPNLWRFVVSVTALGVSTK